MNAFLLLLATVTVGTWNGNWFPSGRAEHRADPEVEAATIRAAGAMLRRGLDRCDPSGTNDVILCLNEMRGLEAASELCAAIGRTNLTPVIVSGYRRRDRFDMQQDVIATTLPVVSTNWCRWKSVKKVLPPRGYAHALVCLSPAVTASVYAVHLKSDYGATTAAKVSDNRAKRELAVSQLIAAEHRKRGDPHRPVIVAGDFNADAWSGDDAQLTPFRKLVVAGFANPLAMLEPTDRVTWRNRSGKSAYALDYIFLRDLGAASPPLIEPGKGVSDHSAVFFNLSDF